MNTISLFQIFNIYEYTTLILGIGSLIMGITLVTLRSTLKNSGSRSKSGLCYIAMAMFVLSIVNLLEYTTGNDMQNEQYLLSVVVFTASIELFLLYMAYMSMLCNDFATKRRIYIELGCIAIFTTPIMFVSPTNHPLLFDVLFIGSVVFYIVKFICNYLKYRKLITKAREEIENLFSDDSNLWLKWIINTFHVVLCIGVVSVIVPMTNLAVLVAYNSLVILSYFYIYISVIRNIYIFDKSMLILENDVVENSEIEDVRHDCSSIDSVDSKPAEDFMSARQKLLDDWIISKGYAEAGVTATEVAKRLKTNRTKLSLYLKTELNTTYYEWIAVLRIEDAKRQLIDYPDRAISEIALNVGIEDRDNFRHAFQRHTGVSPTAYRKEHLGWN